VNGGPVPETPRDWTEPGAFAVSEGVYRIPLPLPNDGLRAVNVYAIQTSSGLLLIDGGWALEESRRQLEWALEGIGARPSDIARFLVTHAHRDHYTQAAVLRREYGSRISLGAGERHSLDAMAVPGASHGQPQLRRLRRAGAGPVVESLVAANFDGPVDLTDWDPPDEWLDGTTRIPVDDRDLLGLPTPGHTRGHFVFADTTRGMLFAGDHVLPHITPSIGFEYAVTPQPLADYLDSLAKMRQLPDMLLLPAHGPATESVHARVDQLLAHHADRLDTCVRAVAGGAGTAYEVAKMLRWTRRGRHLLDLDTFNQMLAVLETAAHLDLLVAQGRLTCGAFDNGPGPAVYAHAD
jgi:glyoxylase-like metal-dependent hydrolase (beta-lactamase superfamily II)